MKILMPLYPCEGCCDQCYALNDLRVFFDTAYCEYCWGERSESNWPLWDDAEGAVALPEVARGPVLSDAEVGVLEYIKDVLESVNNTAGVDVIGNLLERAKR